ncbi:TPR end-of-group domain-containing protein [Nostoc sp.]|uniref:TPR end-of-group domain-containing protein n=1 Tax=Nostoc sp. TaxID=1180 RepID=UPI002FF84799
MTTPIPYYISRKQAQDFLAKFTKALEFPESNPLLFQVYGFGGVGKTTLIKQLKMQKQGIDFESGVHATIDCFDWLTKCDFVEFVQDHYRLDDVARNVFRFSFCNEDRTRFRETHKLLATYFEQQANQEKAVELQTNDESGHYGKACYFALQSDVDLAIENLEQAINLSPRRCRREAKFNPDFDSIRDHARFQALLQG